MAKDNLGTHPGLVADAALLNRMALLIKSALCFCRDKVANIISYHPNQ